MACSPRWIDGLGSAAARDVFDSIINLEKFSMVTLAAFSKMIEPPISIEADCATYQRDPSPITQADNNDNWPHFGI